MAPKCSRAVFGSTFLFLCCSLSGFQAPGENGIDVKPRAKQASFTRRADAPPAELRIDSYLVEIPVHITKRDGSTITDMSKDQFHVLEEGVEQKITYFSHDDAPLSIGILFDTSGSMQNKMRKSSEAAATFFKTANLQDEFFLVEFNERAKLTVPFTPDSNEIFQRISHIKPYGRTSLFDAIHIALTHMKQAKNLRKAIVIVSDGGDNRSRFNATQIKNAVAESDVQLYAMGIFDHDMRRLPQEEQNGPHLLDALADETGGRLYSVNSLNELDSISEHISRELRDEYVIGYSPSNSMRDGKYRHVRVQVTPPAELHDLRSYYRHGYYAPTQ